MSVLQFPRVYFRGEISWDPGLANNTPNLYDPEKVALNLPAGVRQVSELKPHIIDKLKEYGIWNYYGTHDAVFERVVVTGGATAPGSPAAADDPLVGKQLALRGKLVDLDSRAVQSSQIFFDRVVLGDAALGLRGARSHRMNSRWIRALRNLAPLQIAGGFGVTWQTVIAKADLQLFGQTNSPLLGALATALQREEVAGLMIRFQNYRTLYFQNGLRNNIPQQPRDLDALRPLYQQGDNFSNPAYSALVGVVGLWLRGEPASAPGGRFLAPANPVTTVRRRINDQDVDVPVRMGPSVVELDETRRLLSVDLGSAVPETDENLEKADLGDIELAVEQGGAQTTIAALPFAEYNKGKYEASAGIVDIDLAAHADPNIADKIRQGRLVLNCRQAAGVRRGQAERTFYVIASDRDIYLNENEERAVQLSVYRAGAPAPAGVRIQVSRYGADRVLMGQPTTLTVAGGGTAELRLKAGCAGFITYNFIPFADGEPEPTPPVALPVLPTSEYFVNVRTLPHDDALERSTPDAGLTWDFVYENILSVYDAINPVMSRTTNPNINKPLGDRDRMMALAQSIKRVISEGAFEDVKHMPITRDMSDGRRRLLERWCDLVLAGDAPEALAEGTPEALAAAAPAADGGAADAEVVRHKRDPRVANE